MSAIFDPKIPDYQYLPYFYSRIFDLGWQVQLFQPSTVIIYYAYLVFI